MNYLTYDEMSEAQRKAIVTRTLTEAGLSGSSANPKGWNEVRSAERPVVVPIGVVEKIPQKGDVYFAYGKWQTSPIDFNEWSNTYLVRVEPARFKFAARSLTDRDLGRRIEGENIYKNTISPGYLIRHLVSDEPDVRYGVAGTPNGMCVQYLRPDTTVWFL